MNGDLLALKPYLDSVECLCRSLSEPKLTGIILGLAKSVPARERRGFLETIEKLSNDLPSESWDEGILERIQAFKADIDR